jgi:Ras-related GTP-binding protein C/D
MDIILAGLSRVGKSSIKKVVFEKMSPHTSVYNETCLNIESYTLDNLGYTSLIVRDYPNNYRFDNITNNTELKYIQSSGTLIYIVDCQELSEDTYDHMKKTINSVLNKNPKIFIDIFLHKIDGAFFIQNTNVAQKNKDIGNNINKILQDIHMDIPATVYKTSIYDHSLFEAFSRIFQKLMPQNSLFSKLIDNLSQYCKFEKAYLFDVTNKIYIAIDYSPIDEQLYETCTDMIDIVLDMIGIYGEKSFTDFSEKQNLDGDENNLMEMSENTGEFFDSNGYSLITINNLNRGEDSKSHLYLRFIDSNLALISIINDEDFERAHLMDFNIKIFRDAVKEIFGVSKNYEKKLNDV